MSAEVLIKFFWVFIFLLNPVNSQLEEQFLTGFNPSNNVISLNGVSKITQNGLLQLTNKTPASLGHAFYSSRIKVKNFTDGKAFSFSTSFAFAIVPQIPKLGGHGFAFTISPTKDLTNSFSGHYLGLFNISNVGNFSNHIFAVEFDTVLDSDFHDINGNHVGVNINTLVSTMSVPAAYVSVQNSTNVEFDLMSGEVVQAWIDYNSSNNQLQVKLSPSHIKPRTSVLSMNVDLSPIFEDYMFVGFSGATGVLSSSHYILGWSFTMNGEAKSLNLQTLPQLPKPDQKNQTSLTIGVSVGGTLVLCFVIISMGVYIVRKTKNSEVIESWELDIGPHRFSYKELNEATRGFRDNELLGFGGFGRVYKGTLPDSETQVAIKRISHESKQGLQEFVAEIASIGRLRHKSLVQLLGWCRQKADLLLVYELMPNGSLDKYIFGDAKVILTWEQRFKIIKDVASGLLYLHEEWEQTVIHRDIKAANVLLDSDFNGKLSDFGLAKLYERGSSPGTTRVVGTLGYLAPELTTTGKPTASSDVFAFGALMLEVVCGRRPIEPKASTEELVLVDWVWDKWRVGAPLDAVDQRLGSDFDEVEAILGLQCGLLCSSRVPEARPTMREVVRFLDEEVALPEVVVSPNYCDRKKGCEAIGLDNDQSQDYTTVSNPTNSFEKKVSWSSDGDGEVDVGDDSISPV